jgi:2-polyprenyl-6-methoxyphenol hydroxylase-like FAD-dependent oxidoreductase
VTINTPVGSFSILTLPSDAGTWCVTLYGSSRDQPLKALRDPARWTALVRACPRHAHWLEGEPTTPVMPMGGVVDRVRSLNGNGAGPALGVLSLGDAWACTNPSLGRGMSLGLAHAAILRRVVRECGDRPADLTAKFAADTERELAPWYENTVLVDRSRMAQIEALRAGVTPPAPEQIGARVGAALPAAMSRDPEAFRAGLEISSCLTLPREVFARPGFAERVLEQAAQATRAPFGPDREGLLALLR